MRTETLAIVFTDIKGYTATTSAQSHQENARLLRRIQRLVEPVVTAFDGRKIKSIGDAYMIVFRSPTEAVRCAMAIQDRLHLHNAAHPGEQAIHIRIAMNIGEVRVDRGDVYGEPVNIAARVESVTPADEIYFTKAVHLTMNRTDVVAERVGEYDLKGVPEAVTLYRVKRYADLDLTEEEADPGVEQERTGLPFGGKQLERWKRTQWLRRLVFSAWILAPVALGLGTYLRYRLEANYASIVAKAKKAVEQGDPLQALAEAGQIPVGATRDLAVVKRYREKAISMLLERNVLEVARSELERLLRQDKRDAEALLLYSRLLRKEGQLPKEVLEPIAEALKVNPTLTTRPEVLQGVVEGYGHSGSRKLADIMVVKHLKQSATEAMLKALNDGFGDRMTRSWMAKRLEKLGAGDQVDWMKLAIDDLRSTSCKIRKTAITRLMAEGDEEAVGPLMKLAESKGCHAPLAKKAALTILGK